MLMHVSMPADDCRVVAEALAELMDGAALTFPPGGPGAWNAWSRDEAIQIVVTPRGQFMIPGATEAAWTSSDRQQRASETHFALTVPRSASEILGLAERHGWPARICDRGGFFRAVELWVEGAYLVELLDPAFAAEYRRSMTKQNWLAQFGV